MSFARTFIRLLLCAVLLQSNAAWAAPSRLDAENAKVRIAPGDSISIIVFPVEEYSREVTVQPDGKIELPLVGSLGVNGMAPKEVQDILTQKYSKYVANPEITVTVRRFASRRLAIIGEIHSPGYYEYRDGMKLLELVSLAGGLGDNAKAAEVRILKDGDKLSAKTVNFKAVLAGRTDRDIVLSPGDVVFIPRRGGAITATWINTNILPWATLFTMIGSAFIIADRVK